MKRTFLHLGDMRDIRAFIPAPATEGDADRWATETGDFGDTKRVVDGLIEAAIDPSLSKGTLSKAAPKASDKTFDLMKAPVKAGTG